MGRKLSDAIPLDGFTHVLGIDEVGWGALAGPITVAGVVLPVNLELPIKDSKRYTTERSRKKALHAVEDEFFDCCVVTASPYEIDTVGYSKVLDRLHEDILRVLLGSKEEDDQSYLVVLDGVKAFKNPPEGQICISLPKADDFVSAVSAASCLAKVHRDEYMSAIDERSPFKGWDFYKNKGYGTKDHIKYLKEKGPIEGFHRSGPVSSILGKST